MVLSTGIYGNSAMYLLSIDFETCAFNNLFQQNLEASQFGEGMTVAKINGNNVGYQLTWKEDQVLKWRLDFDESSKSWDPKLDLLLGMPKYNQMT